MLMDKDIKEIVATREDIYKLCENLGKKITEDFKDEEIVFLGVLNGCNPFMSDLIRHVDLMITVDYLRASSYHGTLNSSGEIKLLKDLDCSIKGKNVIIVDDIIDTGRTLKYLYNLLALKGAKKIKTCCLLDKKSAREIDYNADYIGLEIPKKFVVGYGLDYQEHYRNLPYIGVLKEEVYSRGDE